jgi:hypothetical protein
MGVEASGGGISRRDFAKGAVAGAAIATGSGGLVAGASARDRRGRDRAERKNLELVGFDDLQARSAYQPLIEFNPIARRWIAYVGHHAGSAPNPLTGEEEPNGTSILDVTDPRRPRYLVHIPGAPGTGEGGGCQMVRVVRGSDLPKGDPRTVYMLRTRNAGPPEGSSHQIFNVTNPARPTLLNEVVGGLNDTHKSWWEPKSGIAFLVSGVPGWRAERMTQVFDLSDPTKPVHIRDYGLVGQEPGSTGPIPTDLHGPISVPERNRIYFAHGTSANGIFQIVDREKLLTGPPQPTPENLLFPQIARVDLSSQWGAHTTFPVLDMVIPEEAAFPTGGRRDIVVIVNESTDDECTEDVQQMVFLADVTHEATPQIISNYHVPEESGDFCSRGGRFGAHSSNENMTPIYYKKIVFVSWFNAGVRAVDIRNPFEPKEAGFYIPEITENTDPRCITVNGQERCKTAIQTNNVEVDNRGYIYIVDRANTGMHVLRPTGKLAAIAGH